jgi:single-stranded DNA-binding protein
MSTFLRTLGAGASATSRAFSTSARRELSRITLIGNLAGPPETVDTANGRSMIRYGVAVNSGPRDNRHTSWFRITSTVEGGLRDFILNTPKGSLLCVEGNAVVDQWTTPDGQQRSGLKIWQTNFEVLKRPARHEEGEGEGGNSGEEGYGR